MTARLQEKDGKQTLQQVRTSSDHVRAVQKMKWMAYQQTCSGHGTSGDRCHCCHKYGRFKRVLWCFSCSGKTVRYQTWVPMQNPTVFVPLQALRVCNGNLDSSCISGPPKLRTVGLFCGPPQSNDFIVIFMVWLLVTRINCLARFKYEWRMQKLFHQNVKSKCVWRISGSFCTSLSL